MSGPDRQRSSFDAATEAVLLASRAVVAIAARSLAAWAEVTLVQFRALVLLDRDGTLSAGRPAELLVVAPSTVTGLCDRLIAKRLVERAPPGEAPHQAWSSGWSLTPT